MVRRRPSKKKNYYIWRIAKPKGGERDAASTAAAAGAGGPVRRRRVPSGVPDPLRLQRGRVGRAGRGQHVAQSQQTNDAAAPVHYQAVEHAQPARTQTRRVQGSLRQRFVSVLLPKFNPKKLFA